MTATKFGVEIEFLGLGDDTDHIHDLLSETGKIKLSNVFAHERYRGWEIHEDFSVEEFSDDDYEQGAELVSPILSYDGEGLQQVVDAISALKDKGAWVNKSCGLHVHVDARFVRRFNKKNRHFFLSYLISQYEKNEKFFDYLVAEHRRGDDCDYAMSMNGIALGTFLDHRNYKLNIHSYLHHGTIEFRQHEGCLDPARVTNWIGTCVRFMEDCREKFAAMSNKEREAIFDHVNGETYEDFSSGQMTDF